MIEDGDVAGPSLQRRLQASRQRLARRQAVARGDAVAQHGDFHRLRLGLREIQAEKRYQQQDFGQQ